MATLRTTDRDFSRFPISSGPSDLRERPSRANPEKITELLARSAGDESEQLQGDADEDEN
jgi:hypothetical protein